jgi:hypothetical protein
VPALPSWLSTNSAGRPSRLFAIGRAGVHVVLWTRRTRREVVTDEPAPATPTVRDRLTAAGLCDERIAQRMTAGRVRVDGELGTDLEAPRRPGTRVVV